MEVWLALNLVFFLLQWRSWPPPVHSKLCVQGVGLLPVTQEFNSVLSQGFNFHPCTFIPAIRSLAQFLLTQSATYWTPPRACFIEVSNAKTELSSSLNSPCSVSGNEAETQKSFYFFPFPHQPHLIAHQVLPMSLQRHLFPILDPVSSPGLLEPSIWGYLLFFKKETLQPLKKKGASSLDSQMI